VQYAAVNAFARFSSMFTFVLPTRCIADSATHTIAFSTELQTVFSTQSPRKHSASLSVCVTIRPNRMMIFQFKCIGVGEVGNL